MTHFIGVHSGLPYTQLIHSKPNTCVRTYYYTMESINYVPFMVMLTVTLSNKFMVIHR